MLTQKTQFIPCGSSPDFSDLIKFDGDIPEELAGKIDALNMLRQILDGRGVKLNRMSISKDQSSQGLITLQARRGKLKVRLTVHAYTIEGLSKIIDWGRNIFFDRWETIDATLETVGATEDDRCRDAVSEIKVRKKRKPSHLKGKNKN